MKKWIFILLMILLTGVLFLNGLTCAKQSAPSGRIIDPIVSTDWLAANLGLKSLVILDIRSAGEYGAGHLANAINVPFEVPVSAWIVMKGDLLLELPDDTSLFTTIGSCGITKDSVVVIVTTTAPPPNPPYPLANATRVADTLIYAGIKNVAILDGGYPKWLAEGKPITTEAPKVTTVIYQGKVNQEMFVTTEYVRKRIGKSLIIDARDADVYFGVTLEPFANKAGHIPTAKSLPAPWMWNPEGTYKSSELLKEMVVGIIQDKKEIILYCGVGGYESSWWFVLTQMLGYDNVKLYDGAAQEWVKTNDMTKFKWE